MVPLLPDCGSIGVTAMGQICCRFEAGGQEYLFIMGLDDALDLGRNLIEVAREEKDAQAGGGTTYGSRSDADPGFEGRGAEGR